MSGLCVSLQSQKFGLCFMADLILEKCGKEVCQKFKEFNQYREAQFFFKTNGKSGLKN